jgi:hypothetical protein
MNRGGPALHSQSETRISDRLINVDGEVERDPSSDRVVVAINISVHGRCSVRILADHSDECDRLSERLTAARPILDMLAAVMRADQ